MMSPTLICDGWISTASRQFSIAMYSILAVATTLPVIPLDASDDRHRLLIPCSARDLLWLARTRFSCRANSQARPAKPCRAYSLSLGTRPLERAAGGVALYTSRSLSAVFTARSRG